MDLGLIDEADRCGWAPTPTRRRGRSSARSTWKVIGFGMLLFVAAIQAIPHEINEAAVVDGASYWQRVRRVTVPLTAPTILLVTLISVIGSLLAFDQFYIMTAGQPFNQTATAVFYVYLNSFPYLQAGLRGGAVAAHRGDRAAVHGRPADPHPPEPRDERRVDRRVPGPQPRAQPADAGRRRVAPGTSSAAICVVDLRGDAARRSCWRSSPRSRRPARPPRSRRPTCRTALSLDSYTRLWDYQAGLPTYLVNSLGTALLTIVIALGLTIPAGYALARFPIPCKEPVRLPAAGADHPVPGAADADVPDVRPARS